MSARAIQFLAIAGVAATLLVDCATTARQAAYFRIINVKQPVAPVDRRDFAAGSSRYALEEVKPTSRGSKMFQAQALSNDTVGLTLRSFGIPDAVEATVDSNSVFGSPTKAYILFYRRPPQTVIIDNSGVDIWRGGAKGAVVADLPAVPRYARVFGFDEPVSGAWPATISSADASYFSVPPTPQAPPAQLPDGSDYAPVAQQILKDIKVVHKGVDYHRAQGAFARLAEVAATRGLTWKLYVYDATHEAGYGVPDGSIFITTKLIERLDDDELTAILAHLMAHERYGHSRNAMKRANREAVISGLLAPVVAVTSVGYFAGYSLVMLAAGTEPFMTYLQLLHYKNSEELEADALAAQYLAQLHIPASTIVNAMYQATRYPPSSGEPAPLWFGNLHNVRQSGPDFGKLLDAGRLQPYAVPHTRDSEGRSVSESGEQTSNP